MTIKIKEPTNDNRQIVTIADKSTYYSYPPYLPYPTSVSNSYYSPIYVTDNEIANSVVTISVKSRLEEVFKPENTIEFYDTFAHFFKNIDTVFIPKKAKRHIERNVPKSLLKKIDKDINTSIELSLIILSNLSWTVYANEKWKNLSSTIMDEQTRKGNDNTRIYTSVLNVLKYSTNTTQGIIQVKTNASGAETYQQGVSCKSYSLTPTYLEAGLTQYVIKNNKLLKRREEFYRELLTKAHENIIANNLLNLYRRVELPNYDGLKVEAKRLVDIGYTNKKGKKLIFLNKYPKLNNNENLSYVEQHIKQFDYLTQLGLMIPIIGDNKSGGRVVDSFTLMSSWIRRLVKIDGEPIVEVDFKALHPNIAMSIYGGSKKYITHQQIAQESNLEVSEVKIQHLSYFNKEVRDMKRSPLYEYYNNTETLMNQAIIQEKQTSLKRHKITSMRMFAKEVEIMTECIKQLNAKGIYVGYVYDALFCKIGEAEIVKAIMDKVVIECGVYTIAEINY